ncbi:MAG: hypothetical protein M1517_06985 [Deltaproteobacteria bacterium]|nr:hypothetical protein [Deltaproteobacteria bacterium]
MTNEKQVYAIAVVPLQNVYSPGSLLTTSIVDLDGLLAAPKEASTNEVLPGFDLLANHVVSFIPL